MKISYITDVIPLFFIKFFIFETLISALTREIFFPLKITFIHSHHHVISSINYTEYAWYHKIKKTSTDVNRLWAPTFNIVHRIYNVHWLFNTQLLSLLINIHRYLLQGKSTQWCVFRRLNYHWTACSQCSCCFPCYHSHWKIPLWKKNK